MAFKIVLLAALIAVGSAGFIPAAPAAVEYQQAALPTHVAYHASPVAYAHAAPVVHKTINPEDDPHPQYNYAYDVQDATTGDFKTQQESRDGDVVHGSYSLLEADGTRRIVDYTADPVNGFNAVVHKEPAQVAVNAVHAAPVVHAAPAYAYHH